MASNQYAGIILMVAMFAVFYFLIIRPQKKREKKVNEMRNSLEEGNEIVTIGGIAGTVAHIKDDMVTIEVGADRTKLTVMKWAIGSVQTKNEETNK
jgi:preprotein translocase subunit YajC